MLKSRLLSISLSLLIITGGTVTAFADQTNQQENMIILNRPVFADMPNNWATIALEKAVFNGLLAGYTVGEQKLIKAENPLTRAEMATIIDKAFGSTAKADMQGVTDVKSDAWYADYMSSAVQMESFSKSDKMRPTESITREEAFTVLAKVFKLEGTKDYDKLNTFTDKDTISAYAKDRVAALLNEGYVSGHNGELNPKDPMTRGEFAAMMDNLVKQYIKTSGEVTQLEKGNIIINATNVTLKNVEVKGNLILAEGVGTSQVQLENVQVKGTVVLRCGNLNMSSNSFVPNIIKPDTSNVTVSSNISLAEGAENSVNVTVAKGFAELSYGKLTEKFNNEGTKITGLLKKGTVNYNNVRFVISPVGEANLNNLQLIAKDTSDTFFNVVKSGWGPATGMPLADAATDFYVVAKAAGTYTFKATLIDVSNNNAIITESVVYTVVAE